MKPIPVKYMIPEDCTEEDSVLLCPKCEDPPDYCLDHNHYLCEDCQAILEIENDDHWHCLECDELDAAKVGDVIICGVLEYMI